MHLVVSSYQEYFLESHWILYSFSEIIAYLSSLQLSFIVSRTVTSRISGHGYQASATLYIDEVDTGSAIYIYLVPLRYFDYSQHCYLSTNAINIFPTLASKSLMKILNDMEARIDP